MTRLNAEIEDDVYRKWKEHSNEGDRYANLTHLVRVAVENQIHYDQSYDSPFTEVTKGGAGIGGELEEFKQEMNKTLISLQNDINQLQIQAEGTEDDTLLSNLMSEFHDLVTLTTEEEIRSGEAEGTSVDELVTQLRTETGVGQDVREIDARKSLEELSESIPTVESFVDESGTRHYYEQR